MNDEFLGNDFGSLSLNHHKGSFGSEVLQLQTTMKEVGLVVLGFFFFFKSLLNVLNAYCFINNSDNFP